MDFDEDSIAQEIFIGLVGPIGTDIPTVFGKLEDSLQEFGYHTHQVRLSELLDGSKPGERENTPYVADDRTGESREKLMSAGDDFCKKVRKASAVAMLGISSVRAYRLDRAYRLNREDPNISRIAHVFWSLKRPKEVELLRKVYGNAFLLVGVHQTEADRKSLLASQLARGESGTAKESHKSKAEKLIARDNCGRLRSSAGEAGWDFGQDVGKTFPLCDFFVDGGAPGNDIRRIIRGVFGYPFHSPTKDERGMFAAASAALQSTDLSRQVGAAIVGKSEDILCSGSNEVPRPHEGPYWEGAKTDLRDFTVGHDPNEVLKNEGIRDLIEVMCDAGWLESKYSKMQPAERKKAVDDADLLRGNPLGNPLEYGRVVHAEMNALMAAARLGLATQGATLYCTTFPCHLCARHIIGGGIHDVVYIEPYPKSRVTQLYPEMTMVDGVGPTDCSRKSVGFKPFVGVAPGAFEKFFSMTKGSRKEKGGFADPGKWDSRSFRARRVPRWKQPRAAVAEFELRVTAWLKDNGPVEISCE